MESSICCEAHKCGAFTPPACTNEMRIKSGCNPVPLKPNSNATDRLNELLPKPTIGHCQIGSEKNVPVYEVNDSVKACLDHYVRYVLQNRPMPKKLVQPNAEPNVRAAHTRQAQASV